ncbi:MAG: hypothetical protein RMK34_06535 [Tepidimonas sp.]|uniref:hypothetical protein n=1 Tax=Tepidimonas sp. TaxID=2002775 RepID=UPI00298EE1F8|nr:hypothetical protein [Tepidimonas sp.]MCS6810721.1 hypothetical protein [Tepidimonas sp.]MDW8336614.1 hypothetical protein [Tepidimonas sp.]
MKNLFAPACLAVGLLVCGSTLAATPPLGSDGPAVTAQSGVAVQKKKKAKPAKKKKAHKARPAALQ